MRTLNVALIGQGFMGRAHSNAWRQVVPFFAVPFRLCTKVICGRNQQSLERMAAAWGWEETATDWQAVVERRDIDVVDICLPNYLHAPVAIAAAERGKMVLCEKPLALSVEEGARMAAAARDVPNMAWYNYRRIPAIAFAHRLIDEGRIGEVFHYRATYLQEHGNDPTRPHTWKLERGAAGSGALGDLLSHLVDMALYLNGAFAEVSALLRTFAPGREIDDATLLLARFANGSVGTFEATRYAVGCRNRHGFEMHGSKGMLGFHFEDMNHLRFLDATEPRNLQGPRDLLVTGPDHPYWNNFWKPGHPIGYEHTFIAALGDFLAAVDSDRAFHPNFEDAQQVQLVLDAVDRSAHERRWVSVG